MIGEIGGADLGKRQSDEAPLAAEQAVADLRHDRVGHALIWGTLPMSSSTSAADGW